MSHAKRLSPDFDAWIDPKEKLVMILMIQSAPANNALRRDFENAVMQSIVR